MKISVIIPTLEGRQHMLKEALASLCDQTRLPDEVVIIWGKEHIRKKFNRAIRKCKGDAFLPFCDDDLLDPTYLERVEKEMEAGNWDIVGTFLEEFGGRTEQHGFEDTPFGTSLIKKELWKKVGGYDERIGVGGDFDFFTMCKNAGAKIGKIAEPLLKYRIHANNFSNWGNWEESNKIRAKKYENLSNNSND